MNAHTFKIVTPQGHGVCSGVGTTIEMDGAELKGVAAIDIDRIAPDSVCRVSVTMLAPMIVEMAATLFLAPAAAEKSRLDVGRLLAQAMLDEDYDASTTYDEDHGLGAVALRFMALLVEQSGAAD